MHPVVQGLIDWLGNSHILWNASSQHLIGKMQQGPQLGYAKRPGFLLTKGVPVPSPLPKITEWQQAEGKIEVHDAKRAGTHLDLRLKINGVVYDFAVVKTKSLPAKTGQLQRVVRTPNHSIGYFYTDKAEFGPGEYGEGKMNMAWRGPIDVHHANKNKIEFSIPEGEFKGRYCVRNFGEKGWSILRMKAAKEPWKERREYTATAKALENAHSNPNMIAETKIDGANYSVIPGPKENVIISRRLSVDGKPINRAANIPQLKYHQFPKELYGKTLHCEIIAEGGSSSYTAGLLNSNPGNSRAIQLQSDKPLVAYIWDLEAPGSYEQRHGLMKGIARKMPRVDQRKLGEVRDRFAIRRKLNPPLVRVPLANTETKETTKEFAERMKSVEQEEGVVLKDKTAKYYEGEPWVKDKRVETKDMIITGYQEGQGKYVGSLGALIVKDPVTKIESKVGTGLDDYTRGWIWANQKDLRGKLVQCDAHEVTEHGKLRGPRFIGFHPESGVLIENEQQLRDYSAGAGLSPYQLKSARGWRAK